MKMASFTVAVLDHFPQVGEYHIGGNALNQALHFRDKGWEASFVGALGTDAAGDRIEKALRQYGIGCKGCHRIPGSTASNQLENDGNGERFGRPDSWNGGVYQDYRLDESDWRYLAGMDLWASHANSPEFAEALRRKGSNQFFAVDFLHLSDYALLESSINAIDIAFFGGTPDMEEPLADIARRHKSLIVLTLGKDGSIAFEGNRRVRQPALPLEKVIDTTGCGDAFQAGFAASWYAGRNLEEALLEGAALGRKTAGYRGAYPWPED